MYACSTILPFSVLGADILAGRGGVTAFGDADTFLEKATGEDDQRRGRNQHTRETSAEGVGAIEIGAERGVTRARANNEQT